MKLRIREAMDLLGISVIDVSKELNVSRNTVYKQIAQGDSITVEVLERYARLLGVPVSDLLVEEPRPSITTGVLERQSKLLGVPVSNLERAKCPWCGKDIELRTAL